MATKDEMSGSQMRLLHELMELRVEDGVFGLCAVVSLTQSEK